MRGPEQNTCLCHWQPTGTRLSRARQHGQRALTSTLARRSRKRSCSGLHPPDMEGRGLAAWMPSGGALYCTACAKEGRPIAASHHPGESPKSALELEMRQILRSSEAVLEGGARARTCMCMCMCARHVNGDVAPRACSACCTAYRCAYVHVALHIHQASAPRRACATRAGSPRTSRSSSRPWRRRMRLCAHICMHMFMRTRGHACAHACACACACHVSMCLLHRV